MNKNILINAIHTEEKRVAIVEGDRLTDFYVEKSSAMHLKGNIYTGVIAAIDPGLQAAFVDFGQKKQGFLPFREIMPENYKTKPKDKHPQIKDVMEKGQEILVQVERDQRDTKGASLTTYISIPGRYLVILPGRDIVGISRKIEDKDARERLKEAFKSLKVSKNTGFILRTAGIHRSSEDLSNDLKYLTKLWAKIKRDAKGAKAPALIYREEDIAVRTVRDYLTDDVTEVLVDDQTAFKNVKAFLKKTMPWRSINVTHYRGNAPLFDLHSLEDQITRLKDRIVGLPSKGYIVIDRTEALTAIDVNSGRSKKDKDIEALALRTNMEAAEEIARQLRLRDIGGLIVMDFIDMESNKNRRKVEECLQQALRLDKAHYDLGRISKFGLLEATRERMRTAYFDSTQGRCPTCSGAGVLRPPDVVALAALRDIHTRVSKGGITEISCRLPVECANYLMNTHRQYLMDLEKQFTVSITVQADTSVQAGEYAIDAAGPEAEAKTGAMHHRAEKREDGEGRSKRSRRRRKPFRKDEKAEPAQEEAVPGEAQAQEEPVAAASDEEKTETGEARHKRPRRRGRRPSRKHKEQEAAAGTSGNGTGPEQPPKQDTAVQEEPQPEAGEKPKKKRPRRGRPRRASARKTSSGTAEASEAASEPETAAA